MEDIEKCARLMCIEEYKVINGHLYPVKDMRRPFNPLTNKSDLMDLECALGMDVYWSYSDSVFAHNFSAEHGEIEILADLKDYPDKFTARAHAVVAVAVQIYDRREKDGSSDK